MNLVSSMMILSGLRLPGKSSGFQAKTIVHMNVVASRNWLCCATDDFTILQDFLIQCNITQCYCVTDGDMLLDVDLVFLVNTPNSDQVTRLQFCHGGCDLIVGVNLNSGFL